MAGDHFALNHANDVFNDKNVLKNDLKYRHLIGVVSDLLRAASHLQLFPVQHGRKVGGNGLLQDFLMLCPHDLQLGI